MGKEEFGSRNSIAQPTRMIPPDDEAIEVLSVLRCRGPSNLMPFDQISGVAAVLDRSNPRLQRRKTNQYRVTL